jgi:hydroxymethylbilane synthase
VTDELRLGSRGSQLALWQANTVAARIAHAGGPRCRIVVIKTTGDRLQDAPLSEAGGKRLFVKEIEDALLRREIDLAVHSSKDMPVVLPDGLAIAGVLPREDPHDAVVLPVKSEGTGQRAEVRSQRSDLMSIDDLIAILGRNPRIGTSSVRRIAQLTRLLPGARFEPIRGNLDTRLRKLDEGGFDAIVLAAAGLRRLGFGHRISMAMPADACVPAPGQGIVAVEIREDDAATRDAVSRISDAAAAAALEAERAVVETLGGGCQTPVGALATFQAADGGRQSAGSSRHSADGSRQSESELSLVAVVVALDGSRAVRAHATGEAVNARLIGKAVGAQLLGEGAGEILAQAEHARAAGQLKAPSSSE